jgi:hypothetical protein
MSLQIAVAHTGQRLDADPVAFSSVDALKHFISRAFEIPPESQILLTPGGKHVKLQALLTEVCIVSTVSIYKLISSFVERDICIQSRVVEQSPGCYIIRTTSRCIHPR